MKKTIWIVTTLLCFSLPATVYSTILGLEIISENHHIFGQTGNDPADYSDGIIGSYDSTSNESIHNQVEGISWNFFYYASSAESWAGDFKVETYAEAGLGVSYALAESTYTFQSEFDTLEVDITGNEGSTEHWSTIWCSLTNLNTREQLLYYNYDFLENDYSRLISEQYNLIVNPEHVYELTLYTYGLGGDSLTHNSLAVDISPSASPVPEPMTVLLFSTGLIGLTGSRLRRKKNGIS